MQCPGEEPRSCSCRGDMLHRHLGGVGFPDLIIKRLDDSHRNSVKGCSAPSLAEDGSGCRGLNRQSGRATRLNRGLAAEDALSCREDDWSGWSERADAITGPGP